MPSFFKFVPHEYQKKVAKLKDQELCREEVIQIRTEKSGWFGAAGGGILALPTAGASLIGTGIGARRAHVAEQKLAIIRPLMRERGLQLHKNTARDTMIPLVGGIVTMGLVGGSGLESGLVAMAHTTSEAASAHISAQATVQAVVAGSQGPALAAEGIAAAQAGNAVALRSGIGKKPRERSMTSKDYTQAATMPKPSKLNRFHTDSEMTVQGRRHIVYTHREQALLQRFKDLKEFEQQLLEKEEILKKKTWDAVGARWFRYVWIRHYRQPWVWFPDLYVQAVREHNYEGKWDSWCQTYFPDKLEEVLNTFQEELNQLSSSLESWEQTIEKVRTLIFLLSLDVTLTQSSGEQCLPPGPIHPPSERAERITVINRYIITALVSFVLCFVVFLSDLPPLVWLTVLPVFFILRAAGFPWDADMYPFHPARWS